MIDQPAPQMQLFFKASIPIAGVAFRLAQEGDLPALWESCYTEMDWEQFQDHYRYLLRWQEHGRCYVLIAECSERESGEGAREGEGDGSSHLEGIRIIGSGQLIPQRDKAEIAELAVHPDYRNRGIGTAMIEILTEIAQGRTTQVLEIGAVVENQAALRLYRRLGFGRQRLMCLPNGQEAVILHKSLVQRNGDEI